MKRYTIKGNEIKHLPLITIQGSNRLIFVSSIEGIIGWSEFTFSEDASAGRNAEIGFVFVSPKCRNQGIGKRIIMSTIKKLKKEGVIWVSFWTGKEYEESGPHSLYENCGFSEKVYLIDYYSKGIGTRFYCKKVG